MFEVWSPQWVVKFHILRLQQGYNTQGSAPTIPSHSLLARLPLFLFPPRMFPPVSFLALFFSFFPVVSLFFFPPFSLFAWPLCVALCCSALQCVIVCHSVMQSGAVCCSALQCVAVRCSVLQCAAVSCSVLQWVAVSWCRSVSSLFEVVSFFKRNAVHRRSLRLVKRSCIQFPPVRN